LKKNQGRKQRGRELGRRRRGGEMDRDAVMQCKTAESGKGAWWGGEVRPAGPLGSIGSGPCSDLLLWGRTGPLRVLISRSGATSEVVRPEPLVGLLWL
jgi:hypothetical protein